MAERFSCKYAGDSADEYCESCNGISFEIDGKVIQCDGSDGSKGCAGYEKGEKLTIETEKDTTNDDAIKSDLTQEKEQNSKSIKEHEKSALNNEINASDNECIDFEGVQVIELSYLSSCTIKIKDNYYKFEAAEKWDLTNSKTEPSNVRTKLFEKLNKIVDDQVADLLGEK